MRSPRVLRNATRSGRPLRLGSEMLLPPSCTPSSAVRSRKRNARMISNLATATRLPTGGRTSAKATPSPAACCGFPWAWPPRGRLPAHCRDAGRLASPSARSPTAKPKALSGAYPGLYRCVSIGYTYPAMRKDAGFRVRVESELRDQFLEVCREDEKPAAQVIREFMRQYVKEHKSRHGTARSRARNLSWDEP